MKINKVLFGLVFSLVLCTATTSLHAGYTLVDGKLVDRRINATMPVQGHYSVAMNAVESKQWDGVVRHFRIIENNFPDSPFAQEAQFYIGVGYYYLGDYDMANQSLSAYLKDKHSSKHFEESFEYKFAIAEKFREGAKKHIFGMEKLPKWIDATEDALGIYNEVVTSLPSHQLAAKSLFAKGCLLRDMRNYRESIEAFQGLIRRFPKDELAPKAFLAIGDVYQEQSRSEFQNPDLLALAQINLRRFRENFSGDPKLQEAETQLAAMQETFAGGLFETGSFYERTKHPQASAIYYASTIQQFPTTQAAGHARARLKVLEEECSVKTFIGETQ